MPWDREKRGLFQRKQEKPQIKKHTPLKSEGNDGDISIRQLDDGVFLFFKAKAGLERLVIGKESGSGGAGDSSNDAVTKIGRDSVANGQGWLALGSGNSDNGGVIQGAINVTKTSQP